MVSREIFVSEEIYQEEIERVRVALGSSNSEVTDALAPSARSRPLPSSSLLCASRRSLASAERKGRD